ncbi:MAG: hypothetical protein CM1200mP36_10170 [Gammaproteobacteria bacterium]|nr:MAG: hypothetical protein CM1200mP36_10170 [Gammaproteobacteria bacterium]
MSTRRASAAALRKGKFPPSSKPYSLAPLDYGQCRIAHNDLNVIERNVQLVGDNLSNRNSTPWPISILPKKGRNGAFLADL